MKQIYIIVIMGLLNLNLTNSQTVTVDDPTLSALATYTFTYVTANDIGVGTIAPNIIYLTKPSGYSNFAAVTPLASFAPYVTVKVMELKFLLTRPTLVPSMVHGQVEFKYLLEELQGGQP